MNGTYVAGSAPYPWPFDGDMSGDRFALLVVQDDVLPSATHREALALLASDVQRAGGIVLAVVRGGASVIVHGDVTVCAPGRDGFYATALDDVLRRAGRDHLAFAGWHLEIEVHSTLRSANDRGYECLTLTDVCWPADPALADASSSMIQMSGGIFGAVATSAALVAALMSVAATAPAAARPAYQEELA